MIVILNMYVQLSSGARSLTLGLSFHLCLYFMCAGSEGSGKSGSFEHSLFAYGICLEIIRIYHECEGRIEKSIPRDHCLSSLGKPRDAKQ